MASISATAETHRPDLTSYITLYKHFHANPELSHNEHETASTIASKLKETNPSLILETNIGGHGLVAIDRNGSGPTVLLRADIDALPIREETNLDYASTKRMLDASLPRAHADAAKEKPVMHACGHDMHITSLLAAAAALHAARDAWSGTVVFLFQPGEEKGNGARMMLADGLYERLGLRPDVVLGGHVMPMRAGCIGTRRGLVASSADSMDVTLFGRGGHASQPQALVDPVVLASHTVIRLQGIVSREVDPTDHAVVTVASLQAGDMENVVPDNALLKVDVRAMKQGTREKILRSVERIVKAESEASGALKEPEFKTLRTFPFLVNDEDATEKLEDAFTQHFGAEKYFTDAPKLGGSEDFGELATAINCPSVFWTYGGVPADLWDKAEKAGRLQEDIPINHSAKFAPEIMPTLQVATDAYVAATLAWLAKEDEV